MAGEHSVNEDIEIQYVMLEKGILIKNKYLSSSCLLKSFASGENPDLHTCSHSGFTFGL